MKKLIWLKSSKKDLLKFPLEVRREIGFALYVAQLGETHHSAKLFKGKGSGVYEIVSNYNTDTFRAIYVTLIKEVIYVLHTFQKKSKHGKETPREDLKVIDERLKYLKIILQRENSYV